eukprot:3087751-Pleurochrysis_carterae.AAC.1
MARPGACRCFLGARGGCVEFLRAPWGRAAGLSTSSREKSACSVSSERRVPCVYARAFETKGSTRFGGSTLIGGYGVENLKAAAQVLDIKADIMEVFAGNMTPHALIAMSAAFVDVLEWG